MIKTDKGKANRKFLYKFRKAGFGNLVFIFPAMVLFVVFSVYPLIKTFQLSVYDWSGIGTDMTFVAMKNYVKAFSDMKWWHSVGNGFLFGIMALLFMNSIALMLAIFVSAKIKGALAYRVIFYIPPIMSGIVVGYIWKWMYDPLNGILNNLLSFLHLDFLIHDWLNGVTTALGAVIVAAIWQGIGGSFLLFLAGLQAVPKELYEAAEVDGASKLRQLQHITVPMLQKTYLIVSILTILGSMQTLGIVVSMTNGGPGGATDVPALRIYNEAFKNYRFGYASALSVILGIMLLLISWLQMKIQKKKD